MQDDGAIWYGLPIMVGEFETYGGARIEFAYLKWLSQPITGIERDMLPVHAACLCFQWSMVDKMGLDAVNLRAPKQNYGVAAVERIVHVATIMPIGKLPAAVNKQTMLMAKRAYVSRLHSLDPHAEIYHYWPWEQIRPGELFMLNVHAYDGLG